MTIFFFAGDEVDAVDLNAADKRQPRITILNNSSTPAAIPTGGGVINFALEVIDVGNWHDTASNTSRVTVDAHAIYEIVGAVQFASATGGTNPRRGAGIRVNGGTIFYGDITPSGTGNIGKQVTVDLELQAGDYIELWGFQDSGANINIGDNTSTRLRVKQGYTF